MNLKSNLPFVKANFMLLAIYWIIIYPVSHLEAVYEGDEYHIVSNLLCLIFTTLICANCLWYLNRNLVFYRTNSLKILLATLGLSLLPVAVHIQQGMETLEFIQTTLIITVLFFSLHQMRCNKDTRHRIIFLMVQGCTLNVILQDISPIIGYSVHTSECDLLLAGIAIIIDLYLLLRTGYTVFNLISKFFILVVLLLYVLHHLNIQFILVTVIPLLIIIFQLCRETPRTAISVLAIMAICIWVSHYLGFFKYFSPITELGEYISELITEVRTAQHVILLGNGANTFPFAHLLVYPNVYVPKPLSGILSATIHGGIFSLLSQLTLCFFLFKYSFGTKTSSSEHISTLTLTLPFIAICLTTTHLYDCIPMVVSTAYIMWFISCQHTVTKTTVKPLEIKIRRVPIALITASLLIFSVTGLVSVYRYQRIINTAQCDDINAQIPNPFVLGKRLVDHEMHCVWNNLNTLPVQKWFDLYRHIEMNEIIPYRPRREIFINLMQSKSRYTPEQNQQIEDLAVKLYPTILTEINLTYSSKSELSN